MKLFSTVLAATLLFATSTVSIAGAPSFPGLPDLGADLLGPEITQEELQEQREHREKLEEFGKKLEAWWWAKHNPKPIPYIVLEGQKVQLPGKFLKAYLKAAEENQLKQAWAKVEKSLKSGDFLKAT